MRSSVPKVAVLIATYNGENDIHEQFDSIIKQKGIDVSLIVSDDGSTDNTIELIRKVKKSSANVMLLPLKKSNGAGANFFRLVRDVDLDSFEYIAFSDQDDIWSSDKLSVAIDMLKLHNSAGYSSNVTAFWPNGKKQLINKAQPQRPYDYMFESAGPGCTFLFSVRLAKDLQKFLVNNQKQCRDVALHDWFTYAFARSRGYKWFIDKTPYLEYRQHKENVVGANVGLKAKVNRFNQMLEGWHIKQSLLIAEILGYDDKFPILNLKRYSYMDRILLILRSRELRRRFRDSWALALIFILPFNK